MNYNQERIKSLQLISPKSTPNLYEGIQDQQRNDLISSNKLQLQVIRKRLYVKSCHDSYQHLRIMVFGLLMKAYTHRPDLVNSIRRVINGTDENHHQKQISNIMDSIPLNQGSRTEQAILNLFTNSLDSEVITPFIQLMDTSDRGYERFDFCKSWIENYFNVTLQVLEFGNASNTNIYFYNDNGILIKNSLQDYSPDGDVLLEISSPTLQSSFLNKKSPSRYQTMNEDEDPSLKQDINRLSTTSNHVRFELSHSLASNSSEKPSKRMSRKIQFHNSNPKQISKQKFSLWDYLCC